MKIKVEFLDDNHKQLIKKNNPFLHDKIVANKGLLDIEEANFRAYGIYMYQAPDFNRQSFEDMERDSARKWMAMEDYFNFGDTLNRRRGDIDRNEVREIIGVAGALSVISNLNEKTKADWTKLPVTSKHSDLDFESNVVDCNEKYCTVEAKGSFVDDNTDATSTINKLVKKIDRKKNDEFVEKRTKKRDGYNIGAMVLADTSNTLRVVLMDPPDISPNNLRKIAILKRLYFCYSHIFKISPRTPFTYILKNRIETIENISNISEIDKQSFKQGNGNEIYFNRKSLSYKSHIQTSRNFFIGYHYIVGDYIFFKGINIDFLQTIADHRFNEILNYKIDPKIKILNVFIRLTSKEMERMKKIDYQNQLPDLDLKNRRLGLWFSAKVYISSAGICFSRFRVSNYQNITLF